MAKKKATPIIKRSVGKDKVVRFFKDGKPFSNKNNKAAKAFVNQDFRKLVASPTAQATLTPFEKLVLRNKQNALKGRDIISEKAQKSSAKRYRIKGRVVSKDVQNTIEFNPSLKVLFKDKNLNNDPKLKNVQTSKEALDILSDMIALRLTKQVQVIIDNDDWINFDRFRPEGTFSRPIEVLNLIEELNSEIPETEPPSQLKVITQSGEELIGQDAYEELDRFIVQITDENRSREGVAALFFLPYKYVSPFFIVDLRNFNEEDEDNFVIQTSEMPRIKQSA
jgi:hypothetical protein